MDIALAAKEETFKAVYGSLLRRFPDSVYPEIITEKIIEFAILIKKFDENNENFATHIVGCPPYDTVREWWDFIVFTTKTSESSDLEFYCRQDIFHHWDRIHFIDNLDERTLWELSLDGSRNTRRLVLFGKNNCNFNNFNFSNITNSAIHPISRLELCQIDFNLWTNIVFPQIIEMMYFSECKISFSVENMLQVHNLSLCHNCEIDWNLFTLPQNLKELDIKKTKVNLEMVQLPDTIERLSFREMFSPFPNPWDLSKCVNLESLRLDTTCEQNALELLLPLSLIHLALKGVKHIPIDSKKYPNLKISYLDKPEKEDEDEDSSEETSDVSANLFVDSDEESS